MFLRAPFSPTFPSPPFPAYSSAFSGTSTTAKRRQAMPPPPPIILLLAISAAVFLVSTNHTGAAASRFLAGVGPKNKKCSADAEVCNTPGSGGPACCGGRCVDTSGDALNCGHCGKICKFTDSCCGGKCVETTYDKRNCGSCGNRCPAGILCFYGMCQYA